MARSLQLTCLIAVCAAFCSPLPAQAQFNPFEALFGSPPRPPAGVPTGRQPPPYYQNDQYQRSHPNEQYQRSPDQQPYPNQPDQPYPPQANVPPGYPPQANVPSGYPPRANVPPGYPPRANVPSDYQPPPPAGYPPEANVQPGQPGIQSQPLPPPTTAAIDPRGPGAQPQALPGLPPGQRQPPGMPGDTSPQPGDEVVAEPPAQKIVNKGALFSGLDKITGRIINFDVSIGETVQFGALQVTPRACYTRPPTETPNTDAFVEVDEVTLQGEVKRIFTGWMFAASPGLHGVEHPIYDVWLSDCKSPPPVTAAIEPSVTAVAQPLKPPPLPPRRPAQFR
ncbi:MAG: DUF2155 domain-containing protein [Xanthobacteraceae bacterium]